MTPPHSEVGYREIKTMCALARLSPPGAFVEVGVYQGGTAWHLLQLAREQGRDLYLYDTFAGIPFAGENDSHKVGDFGDVSIEAVRAALPGARIIQGIFPESLVPMPPVAFAHIDCDQYASVKACCEVLPALMAEGGIMIFDDYGSLPGATKAVDEVLTRVRRTSEGKAFWVKEQVT